MMAKTRTWICVLMNCRTPKRDERFVLDAFEAAAAA
jgi:hypothetical protein